MRDGHFTNTTHTAVVVWSSVAFPDDEDKPALWQQAVMWALGVCIVMANLPVFVVLPRLPRLQRSMCYTMYSLATTDLLLGLESIIHLVYLSITQNYANCQAMCKWYCFFNAVCDSVSILTLSCISIDKCLTLRFPLRYMVFMTTRKTVVMLTTIWLVMIALYIPLLIGEDMNVGVKLYSGAFLPSIDFSRNWTYTSVMMCFVQVLPSIAIFTSFSIIWHTTKQRKRLHLSLKSGQYRMKLKSGQYRMTLKPRKCQMTERTNDMKIIRTLFIMSSGFYIMWTPLFVTVIYWELFTGHTLHPTSDFLFFCLGGANSIVNPLLYIATLDSYRKKLNQMLHLGVRRSVMEL